VAIDMWSLGCVAAELFLGLPLFPGASEHDLLTRVVEMMGPPPNSLLAAAKHTKKFFHRLDVTEVSPSGEPRAFVARHMADDSRTTALLLGQMDGFSQSMCMNREQDTFK
jgi:serine/threonine protein kinase